MAAVNGHVVNGGAVPNAVSNGHVKKRQKCSSNGYKDVAHINAKGSTEMERFDSIFKEIVSDITTDELNNKEISEAVEWFKTVIDYNVPHGKKNRGMTVACSYKYLVSETELAESDLNKARILGWCIEMLQAFFLVADDIMDQSPLRRGRPCWYTLKNVGNIAINDAFYLESSVYKVLRKYFRSQPYYLDMVDLFLETTRQTIIGQGLDLTTSNDCVDLASFSMERYSAIVKWKTAFYSFYLPVAAAMYMAGINDEISHANAKKILLEMGHFFQVQDDYIDCYGDPKQTGKIGTDIEENKCGWLINQALLLANSEQRQVLDDNYGQNDPVKVTRVKDVYNQLDLKRVYKQYEEESYLKLMELIEETHGDLPKNLFLSFAAKIYKREK